MLSLRAAVSLLWLLAVICISGSEELKIPDDIYEIQLSNKAAFARQAMEISDLLRMFISLIKKADEEEGREFGLPEITTTAPVNLESASLEELFDRFEIATQSFRTRFSKYLKSTETPYSSITPTISTVNGYQELDVTKYSDEHENIKAYSVPNWERQTEFSASTVDPDMSDSDESEKSTLALILSNDSDTEMETEYSTSTLAPQVDSSNQESSLVFFLSSEKDLDPEMDTEYSTATEDSDRGDTSSSSDMTTLTYESSPLVPKFLDKDANLILKPIVESNSGFLIGSTSIDSSMDNSETRGEEFVTESMLDFDGDDFLNEKTLFAPVSGKSLNGAATFILESTAEDDTEIEADTLFSLTDDSTIGTTYSTPNDSSEKYTFIPVSTSEVNFDEETTETHSTAEGSSGSGTTLENNVFEETDRTSTFINEDESIEDVTELVKILRKAIESDARSQIEKINIDRELEGSGSLMHDFAQFPRSAKNKPKIADPISEYVISQIRSENWKKIVDENPPLTASYSEIEDTQDRENIANRIRSLKTQPIYSRLRDVTGVPEEDYPIYTNIVATSFTCEGKAIPGFYADLETRCQVFHACWPLRRESYLCPVGTTFNQQILSCDYWFNSTCSRSPDYYDVNHLLKDYLSENIEADLKKSLDKADIYPYHFQTYHIHPVFTNMVFLPFLYKIADYPTERRGAESGVEIDYDKAMEIEFDKNSTLPTFEDFAQQETSTDLRGAVIDRFKEVLGDFYKSEVSKEAEFDEDSSLPKAKLQKRRNVYEEMFRSKLDRSGSLGDAKVEENVDIENTSPISEENHKAFHKSPQSKSGKEQIASEIVFKALETAENIVNKGILPLTKDMLAASYVKLYKRKKS